MATGMPATSWKEIDSLEEQLRTSKKHGDVATIRKFLKGVRGLTPTRDLVPQTAGRPLCDDSRLFHERTVSSMQPARLWSTPRALRPQVRDNGLRRSELVAQLGKDWIQRGGFASQDESAQTRAPRRHQPPPGICRGSGLRHPAICLLSLKRRPTSVGRVASARAGERRLLRRRGRRERDQAHQRPRGPLPRERPRRCAFHTRSLLPVHSSPHLTSPLPSRPQASSAASSWRPGASGTLPSPIIRLS